MWNAFRFLAAVTAAWTLSSAPAPAAETISAHPDLSGLWVISNRSVRGFRDEALQSIQGEVLTPKALATRKAADPALDPSARCLPAMPRQMSGPYPIQILQKPGVTALLFEWDNIFRLIYTDGRAPRVDEDSAWMGRSLGRWEGDVLVVETAGVTDEAWLDGEGTPISPRFKLTERFSLQDDGKTLEVLMKVEDPEVFVRPVFRKLVYNLKPDWEIKDYVCNEGNRDNVFQPRGQPGSLKLRKTKP